MATPSEHPNVPSVDQSDRRVPRNLRQSGRTPMELLISTRVRKSPFWHLSVEAGAWRATVYNRMYHPRGYVRPEDGGAMAEYAALVERVTLWDVAVERQIRVTGRDAEAFVDRVITRNVRKIAPGHAKYVILCNAAGHILNDPVLLRLSDDEFWFSISDSDVMLWLQGVNVGLGLDVEIAEIDVAPLQVQGPRSPDVLRDLVGGAVDDLPYYGLMTAQVAGCPVVVSRTGFSGEAGFEIFVRDASRTAEAVWHAVLEAGRPHGMMVTAPAHHRRIAAGILSWGQDLDAETSPFQVTLGWQVPREASADYVGRRALERQRALIEEGAPPFRLRLVGLTMGGAPVTDYAPDFWLIGDAEGRRVGYVTSPWWSPELETNIALGYVPWAMGSPETALQVEIPPPFGAGAVAARVAEVPFRPSDSTGTRERRRDGEAG